MIIGFKFRPQPMLYQSNTSIIRQLDRRISYLCGEGKSCTTSSCLIPQGRNTARVGGCSGAMQVAYPYFFKKICHGILY